MQPQCHHCMYQGERIAHSGQGTDFLAIEQHAAAVVAAAPAVVADLI